MPSSAATMAYLIASMDSTTVSMHHVVREIGMPRDNRTPTQLGYALAEAMVDKHPGKAIPQVFIMSSDFHGFCKGREFTYEQRTECEKAYQLRYRELTIK